LKRPTLFFFLLLLCLFGCARTNIVDEISILHAISYDLDGDAVTSTALIPKYQEKKSQEEVDFLKAKAYTASGIFDKFNKMSRYELDTSQLKVVLISEEFATKGINQLIKTISNDPRAGSRTQYAIAHGDSAEELMNVSKKKGSLYIFDLINQNIKNENLPRTNLHVLLSDYYGEGRDLFLPHLKISEDNVILSGVVVFKKDQLKFHLNSNETFFLLVWSMAPSISMISIANKNWCFER
jgi:spore germination protein